MQRYIVFNNELSKDQIHHIVDVMRMKIDDNFEIVSNGKCFLCRIISISPFEFKIINGIEDKSELNVDITLFYCLPKGEKLELVIQKATEIGVREIILVRSSRCVMKIKKEDEVKKLNRYQKIAIEATEQSKRSRVPIINKIIDFKDIKNYYYDKQYIAYENEDDLTLHKERFSNGESIAVIVGPEGGFSLEEVQYINQYNYRSLSLGNRILRSETACIYLLSVLAFLTEEL